MLDVFSLLAFIRVGHECRDLFEPLRWNAFVHRLDLGFYSHPKEFWGNGVRSHVNSKRKIPSRASFSTHKRDVHPIRPIPKEALFAVDSINWVTNRNWKAKLLDTRKVTQQKFLRQENVKVLVLW